MKTNSAKESNPAWYVVYTKPRQENIAEEHLNRQGYTTYLPQIKQTRKRRGKKETRVVPLFPRYLFINLTKGMDNWAPIRSTIGTVSMVEFGHNPRPVPDDFITMLQGRQDPDGSLPEITTEYKKGDKVRLTEGPLAGYEAIFYANPAKSASISC